MKGKKKSARQKAKDKRERLEERIKKQMLEDAKLTPDFIWSLREESRQKVMDEVRQITRVAIQDALRATDISPIVSEECRKVVKELLPGLNFAGADWYTFVREKIVQAVKDVIPDKFSAGVC